MKILLMTLALATFSFSALAQSPSDQGAENTNVETMGDQGSSYQTDDMSTTPQAEESPEDMTTTPQAEEDVSDPGLQGTDDTTIQEEEESMRSDTIEGSEGSMEGSESTSPSTTTP